MNSKLDNVTEGPFERAFTRESRMQFLSRIGKQVRWSPAMRSISEFSVYQRAFFSMLGKNVAQFHKTLCAQPDILFSDLVKTLPGPAGVIPDTIWSDFLLRAEHLTKKAHLIQAITARHSDRKLLLQFLIEKKLNLPGSLDFMQHGPAGIFYVGRESTFRSIEEDVFGEKTPSKKEVGCQGYTLQTTAIEELTNCIIVLRSDDRADDVDSAQSHEMKHVYFSSLFPKDEKLGYLDRVKDEIIAYLSEYRDHCDTVEELAQEVFRMVSSYFSEILESQTFESDSEEEEFMDIFCAQVKNMIYMGAQLCKEDPNFWVTLMALPAKHWTVVLARVYNIVTY